jgi:short-subunit dehydrogenase
MQMLMAPIPRKFRSILITGGNSGIGEHLALRYVERQSHEWISEMLTTNYRSRYAEEPNVHLVLVARDEDRLKTVAAKCKDKVKPILSHPLSGCAPLALRQIP